MLTIIVIFFWPHIVLNNEHIDEWWIEIWSVKIWVFCDQIDSINQENNQINQTQNT